MKRNKKIGVNMKNETVNRTKINQVKGDCKKSISCKTTLLKSGVSNW